ncbi:hypothetical protein [Bradyrhizobium brasilense]|uniref:hypothetical protein n=1 Tax=Bradyrhizobium brasilense TaxID=1419277 RepID=UPI001CE32A92|nr:hypothetical protein [Bradyrhizobium brasilense]
MPVRLEPDQLPRGVRPPATETSAILLAELEACAAAAAAAAWRCLARARRSACAETSSGTSASIVVICEST